MTATAEKTNDQAADARLTLAVPAQMRLELEALAGIHACSLSDEVRSGIVKHLDANRRNIEYAMRPKAQLFTLRRASSGARILRGHADTRAIELAETIIRHHADELLELVDEETGEVVKTFGANGADGKEAS